MKRTLAVTLILFACGACASLPFMKKGGPQQSFIVFSSDTIGELKPCG